MYRADKSEAETQPTPITFKLHHGDPPFDVQLRLEGYKPETRTITSDAVGQAGGVAGEAAVLAPQAAGAVGRAGREGGAERGAQGLRRRGVERGEAEAEAEAPTKKPDEPIPMESIQPSFGDSVALTGTSLAVVLH